MMKIQLELNWNMTVPLTILYAKQFYYITLDRIGLFKEKGFDFKEAIQMLCYVCYRNTKQVTDD